MARKVQLVNKFRALVNKRSIWDGKNIMTGANVAFRMRGDSFVPEKIDNQLTASPPELAVAKSRTVFTICLPTSGREKI
jgi:hypothetical protein